MSTTTADDLPWPELGNVSRGATRGNQGQKGVLGPPDRDGRCVLQLRVQAGVLAVQLNRQASEWYRILDNEVNNALKTTKTYWRKARRRQDYDQQADQDHMELHEWLQQLKDKTMSHLELLMQKGDIQGPPYVMPDEIELTFLRKFIERHNAGIPHNPRLRNLPVGERPIYPHRGHSTDSFSPEPSDHGGFPEIQHQHSLDRKPEIAAHFTSARGSESPALWTNEVLAAEAQSSKQTLQAARAVHQRAQKDTQDAFMRYTSCLDVERQARQAVQTAEKRRDEIVAVILQRNSMGDSRPSRRSSISEARRESPNQYGFEQQQQHHSQPATHQQVPSHSLDPFMHTRLPAKPMDWSEAEAQAMYTGDTSFHLEDHASRSRKHSRSWEQPPHLQGDPYPKTEDIPNLPPRKRMHHMLSDFDLMHSSSLHSPSIGHPP